MPEPSPAVKLCECGCGELAPISKYTDKRAGTVKGQPVRFALNHAHRGKVVSAETRAKASAANRGAVRPNWLGDDIGYRALHRYLRDNYPKSGVCGECAGNARRTEWALIHGRSYSRDIGDYRELCRRCHLQYDGQLKIDGSLVSAAREMRAAGATLRRIAEERGVSIRTVARALKHPDTA